MPVLSEPHRLKKFGTLFVAQPDSDRLVSKYEMKPSSCKAKGAEGAKGFRDWLLSVFPKLESDDVRVTPAGVNGPDLQLSPLAAREFGFKAIECKFRARMAIFKDFAQAQGHASGPAVLFLRQNRDPRRLVVIDLQTFEDLIRARGD